MNRHRHNLHYLVGAAAAMLLAACASIGRPNGGEYDYTPPVLLKVTPEVGARNVDRDKIVLEFDENVQLEDITNKVVVSPAQKQNPAIVANGHRVTVELRDTMLPNTTYTIDFSDAIKDLNEGNILDGVAINFSTGDDIDSMKISGMVFEARNLEPAQGMLVGVYSNLSDTALTTIPMQRIAKTNQYGQFTIHGLKPGAYRLYAINDKNRDYHWDRSEDIAFYDVLVSPQVRDSVVTDSLVNVDGGDSIVARVATQFLPHDLLLTWFNENYIAQYVKDYKRPSRHRLSLTMGAPTDSMPRLRPVGTALDGRSADGWALIERNAAGDSIEYFITDSTIIMTDSLQLAVTTFRPDTADVWRWQTDTLRFFFKPPKESTKKKKKKDGEEIDSVPPIDFLTLNFSSGSPQDLYGPVTITTEQPLRAIEPSAIHLEIKRDTLWDTIVAPAIVRADSLKLRAYRIDYQWEPGGKYRLTVDSAAVYGIYGHWNKPLLHEFSVRPVEDYSALYFSISGLQPGEKAIVEILKSDDRPVDTVSVVDGMASFPHILPGEYYARLYIDRNANGQWDTGSIADSLQPEEVFYFPKKLNLRKNWEVEQSWDIYETPVDKQKPEEIKKNKPKVNNVRRRNPDGSYIDDPDDRNRNDYDEDEEDFGGSFYGPGYGNGSRNIGNPNQFGYPGGNLRMR